jgi:hypothetical protein
LSRRHGPEGQTRRQGRLVTLDTYIGEQDPADYVRMVRTDLMGISREDPVDDVGRHVDSSVHLFEQWGLPAWKQKGDEDKSLTQGGKPVRSGKWQIMINGESCKRIRMSYCVRGKTITVSSQPKRTCATSSSVRKPATRVITTAWIIIDLDDKNWRVFVNSKLNAETGEWTMRKVPYVQIVK